MASIFADLPDCRVQKTHTLRGSVMKKQLRRPVGRLNCFYWDSEGGLLLGGFFSLHSLLGLLHRGSHRSHWRFILTFTARRT